MFGTDKGGGQKNGTGYVLTLSGLGYLEKHF